jgi:hypothetical protein
MPRPVPALTWPCRECEGPGRSSASGTRRREARAAVAGAGLYHWDLPQALHDDHGGWQSKDTARAFADHVGSLAEQLGEAIRAELQGRGKPLGEWPFPEPDTDVINLT